METSPSRVVIGIGNGYRGDDGVGVYVAALVSELASEAVPVFTGAADAAALLELWGPSSDVIIVDCTVSCGRAGTIRRFDALHETLPADLFAACSTHSIGIIEAVKLAQVLDRLPQRLVIYGIEGKDFSPGEVLSADVEAAAHVAARRIVQELHVQVGQKDMRQKQAAREIFVK